MSEDSVMGNKCKVCGAECLYGVCSDECSAVMTPPPHTQYPAEALRQAFYNDFAQWADATGREQSYESAKEFCEQRDRDDACEQERERTFAGRVCAYIVLVFLGVCIGLLLAILPAKAESVGFRNPIVTQEKATCANIMLGVQLADAYTTRSILREGGYERDPLARGLVRSDVGAYASAIVLNVAARYAFHRHPAYMCYTAALESAAVLNNLNVLERMNK
jgi:hypothetical protein